MEGSYNKQHKSGCLIIYNEYGNLYKYIFYKHNSEAADMLLFVAVFTLFSTKEKEKNIMVGSDENSIGKGVLFS